MRRNLLAGMLVTFTLTSCFFDSIYVTNASTLPATLTANKSRASAGETVEVTVTGGFMMHDVATEPQDVISRFRLGACMGRQLGTPQPSLGGLCNGPEGELPLPSWIDVTSGSAASEPFVNFVVQRGESRTVEHSFAFTSTEPGEVVIQTVTEVGGTGASPFFELGESIRVTFE